jgi:tetratricopeptide (TPR) repeat protein
MAVRLILVLASVLAAAGPAYGQNFLDLVTRADSLYEQGEYEASGRAFDMALELEPGNVVHHYNAACSWSLAGDLDKAFLHLETAIDRGYRNADHLTKDEDLGALQSDPRWEPLVAKCREAEETYLASINRELYDMFQADQADRRGDIDWDKVAPRDEARRKRAQELIDADQLKAPDDFVHAAFIFQHGADSTSYRLAHELAMRAVALDSTYVRARWIAAAAMDRYLHSVGRPQIYGTQLHVINGVWTLEPIDTTAVSDAERARWGVPPLARQRSWAREMNERNQ